ncbi:MAG: F0F1 ATP synthase subunit B [Bacteroidota bacterium]
MELLTPGTGLIIWQLIIFGLLVFLLSKLAWRPILDSLKIREDNIQEALDSAEKAKEEMKKLKEDNQELMAEARQERDKILKEARDIANSIKEEAKEDASKISEKMIEDAKGSINAEKQAALAEVRNQVAVLSVEIAEKILRKELSDSKDQQNLVEGYIKDLKLN